MKIVSVQRGTVREVAPGTRRATMSGIAKLPVEHIDVHPGGVTGDEIEDLSVHGGEGQAVYLYARDDYEVFEAELGVVMAPGSFGENVTVDAWHEDLRIGDRLATGSTELVISGPRIPCHKFAARMTEVVGPDAGPGWVARFAKSRRPGWYARVLRAGPLTAGEELKLVRASPDAIGGLELMDLYTAKPAEPDRIRRALASPVDDRVRMWLEDQSAT